MALIASWLFLAVGIYLTALLVDGFEVRGFGGALVVSAIFGVLHWLIGWLLFVAIGIATLGIGLLLGFVTRWVVTSLLLKLTDAVTDRLTIRSFRTAFIGGAVLSLFSLLRELAFR